MQIFSKKLTSVLLATVMVGALGACGTATSESEPQITAEPTVEATTTPEMKAAELMQGLKEKATAEKGSKYKLAIDADMKVTFFGQSASSVVSGVEDIESDGVNSYAKGTNTTTVEGEEPETEESEAYFMKEGDSIVQYEMKDGQWTKSTKDYSTYGFDFVKLASVDCSNASLEETDDEYVVTVLVPYDDIDDSLPGETQDMISDTSGVEQDDVQISDIPVVYHFDKATEDIKSISFSLAEAFNETLAKTMEEAIQSAKDEMSSTETAEPETDTNDTETKEDNAESTANQDEQEIDYSSLFSMTINTLKVEVNNISFGAQTVTLPDEAANAVEVVETEETTDVDWDSLENELNNIAENHTNNAENTTQPVAN